MILLRPDDAIPRERHRPDDAADGASRRQASSRNRGGSNPRRSRSPRQRGESHEPADHSCGSGTQPGSHVEGRTHARSRS